MSLPKTTIRYKKSLVLILGTKIGKLTVLRRVTDPGISRYVCECECGTQVVVEVIQAFLGKRKTCGQIKCRIYKKKHGYVSRNHKKPAEYRAWVDMRQRCTNQKKKEYARYGGRGIQVCERWNDFNLFLMDMGNRPSKDHSIHRLDNDKGYSRENCVWTTRDVQASNRSTGTRILALGKTLSATEWSKVTGVPRNAICNRLKSGWKPEYAVTTPLHSVSGNHNRNTILWKNKIVA